MGKYDTTKEWARKHIEKEDVEIGAGKPEGEDLEKQARELGEKMRKWFRDYSGIWYNAPRPNEEIDAIALAALRSAHLSAEASAKAELAAAKDLLNKAALWVDNQRLLGKIDAFLKDNGKPMAGK